MPRTDRFNQLTNFDSPTPPLNAPGLNLHGALSFAGVNGVSRFQGEPDLNNFAPRVGVAWRVTPKTVIRSGGGIFYPAHRHRQCARPCSASPDSSAHRRHHQPGRRHAHRDARQSVSERRQPSGSSLGAATCLGQRVAFYDRSNRVPYSLQWNFDIQRELPGQFCSTSAMWARTRLKLPQARSLNQLPDSALALGDGLRQLVANPFAGQIAIGPLSSPTVARALVSAAVSAVPGRDSSAESWASSNLQRSASQVEKRYNQGLHHH